MRKRELDRQLFDLRLESQARQAQLEQTRKLVDALVNEVNAYDQRIRTLERYLLRGNSSPNTASRGSEAVTVHPPRIDGG